jgi:homospermidine synthase
VTIENYRELLSRLLTEGGARASASTCRSTPVLARFDGCAAKLDVLYIDTVVEPWLGFYFDTEASNASRTNYALRETVRKEKKKNPGGTTAVSCCGANPGMVSWFVKQALVNLAKDTGVIKFQEPTPE